MLFSTLNSTLFAAVVNAAKAKAAGHPAWVRAIEKAAEQVDSNPWIHEDGDALLIASATGNEIYRANGTCQCKAFLNGKPCWHRAAAQLVKRYREVEAQRQAEQLAQSAAPSAWPMTPLYNEAYHRRERAVRSYCVSDRAY